MNTLEIIYIVSFIIIAIFSLVFFLLWIFGLSSMLKFRKYMINNHEEKWRKVNNDGFYNLYRVKPFSSAIIKYIFNSDDIEEINIKNFKNKLRFVLTSFKKIFIIAIIIIIIDLLLYFISNLNYS